MLEIFDSHAHLDATDFESDREQVLERARNAGVTRIVTIGAGYGSESMLRAVQLAEKYNYVWASVGVHPHDAGKAADLVKLRELASHPRAVAIGETGLDYYRDWAPREDQERLFRIQIKLALEVNKPLIIHSREAGEECFRILEECEAKQVGGVFHCFAEDAQFAERLLKMNFMISVPGSVTFKNAHKFREALLNIPMEQIMVETDAPFLAPVPYRGKRCESAFVVETIKALAALKGISFEDCADATTKNAIRFFKII